MSALCGGGGRGGRTCAAFMSEALMFFIWDIALCIMSGDMLAICACICAIYLHPQPRPLSPRLSLHVICTAPVCY